MYDTLDAEINALETILRKGSLPDAAVQERLAGIFGRIQEERRAIDEAYRRARSLLLEFLQAKRGEDSRAARVDAIVDALAMGDASALRLLADANDPLAKGVFLLCHGEMTEAERVLEAMNGAGEGLGRVFLERIKAQKGLLAAGASFDQPLPEGADGTEMKDAVDAHIRSLSELARTLGTTTRGHLYTRLLVAEALLVARRLDAMVVTLMPASRDERLGVVASYLEGKARYFMGDRAAARSIWQRIASHTENCFARWAAAATEALAARQIPRLPAITDFGRRGAPQA